MDGMKERRLYSRRIPKKVIGAVMILENTLGLSKPGICFTTAEVEVAPSGPSATYVRFIVYKGIKEDVPILISYIRWWYIYRTTRCSAFCTLPHSIFPYVVSPMSSKRPCGTGDTVTYRQPSATYSLK